MLNTLRRLGRNKQFREGALIRPEDFRVPFKQDLNLLATMFELRKWFVLNTPHKYQAEKYTNEMAHLHNEINYQASRALLRKTVLVFGTLYAYFWFVSQPTARDWRDTFDIKINNRIYGTMTSSAGEVINNSNVDSNIKHIIHSRQLYDAWLQDCNRTHPFNHLDQRLFEYHLRVRHAACSGMAGVQNESRRLRLNYPRSHTGLCRSDGGRKDQVIAATLPTPAAIQPATFECSPSYIGLLLIVQQSDIPPQTNIPLLNHQPNHHAYPTASHPAALVLQPAVPFMLMLHIDLRAGYYHSFSNSYPDMEPTGPNSLQLYAQQHQQLHLELSQDVPLEQFKLIDQKRIKTEFKLLNSAQSTQKGDIYCQARQEQDRYMDVRVYKHNQLKIQNIDNFYVNASPMRSVLDGQIYAIFAQAPTRKGLEHFWCAVYHYDIKRILMLCAFQDPVRGVQAEKYWPQTGLEVKLPKVNLTLKCLSTQKIDPEFTKTLILVKGDKGERIVEHIHWTNWGDMRKPLGESSQQLFQLLVHDAVHMAEHKDLFLVHCSAGIGRTGTLGTMIEALRCARKNKALSVFRIVDNMRRYRNGCVQTYQQYQFVYQQLQKML